VVGNNLGTVTDCYYSTVIENGTNAAGTQQFSSTAWPAASAAGWSLYDGTVGDWKSLGSWNGGTPDYPELWWEE
jgi:hypothetical protein